MLINVTCIYYGCLGIGVFQKIKLMSLKAWEQPYNFLTFFESVGISLSSAG